MAINRENWVPVVYLTGLTSLNWRISIKNELANSCIFIDSMDHNLKDPAVSTAWYLQAILKSDIIIVNMEDICIRDCGDALLEIGFAVANGKPIFLIDNSKFLDSKNEDPLTLCREVCVSVDKTLDRGTKMLKRFIDEQRHPVQRQSIPMPAGVKPVGLK